MPSTIIHFFEEPGLKENLRRAALLQSKQFSWEKGAKLAEHSFQKCINKH